MPGYFFFFGAYEAARELLATKDQHKNDIGWQKTMVAGAVGGTMLWLAIFPADVVKSRIQVCIVITLYNGLYSRYFCFHQYLIIFTSGSKLKNACFDGFQGYCATRRYPRIV